MCNVAGDGDFPACRPTGRALSQAHFRVDMAAAGLLQASLSRKWSGSDLRAGWRRDRLYLVPPSPVNGGTFPAPPPRIVRGAHR